MFHQFTVVAAYGVARGEKRTLTPKTLFTRANSQ